MFGTQRRRVRRCECDTALPKLTDRPVTWQRADMTSPLLKMVFDKLGRGLYRVQRLIEKHFQQGVTMRTPVVLVAGQGDTDAVVGALLRTPATLVVEHRFDGQVVRRTLVVQRDGDLVIAEEALELAHGCLACTIRNDLLVLLRKLHRRGDVERIVGHLAPWLEPEPICWAINHVRVRVRFGYPDGPAACDVAIAGVVTCMATPDWLAQSLGDDELPAGRPLPQVVVGQAEFPALVVLDPPEPVTLAVLRRLAPRARITVGRTRVELALAHLDDDSRRGRSAHPHAPLLAGLPPLVADGAVGIF